MKKLLTTVLAIGLGLNITSIANSASIGSPKTQGKGKIALTADMDYVFSRDMKYKSGDTLDPGDEVKDSEIDWLYQGMLKISYGLLDTIDLYAKLGVSDFEFKSAYYNSSAETVNISDKGKNAFAYGFGIKAAYEHKNGLIMGVDLQYARHKNKATYKEAVAAGELSQPAKITFEEWHVAPYLAWEFKYFIPYAGVKYSDLRMTSKIDDGRKPKHEADENIGVFFGTDYKLGENFSINLEGRFIDETAVSTGLTWKF